MDILRAGLNVDQVPIVQLESDWLRVDIAPGVGGRVISVLDKASGHEFLWRNRSLRLERLQPGAEYDPNFYGGIDELLPNDMPETIDGIPCPDHGELWTLPLGWDQDERRLRLRGALPQFGLSYEREVSLSATAPCLDLHYRLLNATPQPRHFLWKLHAALTIEPGDVLECPARQARVVDLAWSRYRTLEPFEWPNIEGRRADVIPSSDGTVDFFYLYDLREGRIGWSRPSSGLGFEYQFDASVFPFAWIFASYGGFGGHYTVVLEPCTAMPISVNDAWARGQCTVLKPGESLETRVTIRAGRARKSHTARVK